jgi:hypothetical protein
VAVMGRRNDPLLMNPPFLVRDGSLGS